MNLGGTIRLNKVGIAIICGTIIIFILYMTPRYNASDFHEVNLKELLVASIEVARQGGKEVVQMKKDLQKEIKGKTKEGVNIPVTNADYKSHCIMYYGLTRTFPNLKVISEEIVDEKKCQEIVPLRIDDLEKQLNLDGLSDVRVISEFVSIWIDPLDATKEYTEGLHNYVTTMVCIAYKGDPVIGVIHKPFGSDPQTFWAWLNKGRSTNLQNLTPIKEDAKKVIISKSHAGDVEKLVKEIFGPETSIIQAGGSGYKSLEVAFGNVSAYIHKTEISKWDICAGDAIINALGGRMTSLDGKNIDYSADGSQKNKNGLLAMMSHQEVYVEKLKNKRDN